MNHVMKGKIMHYSKISLTELLHIGIIIFLNLYVYTLIPPLSENMSNLGNKFQHPIYLLIWSLSIATFFLIHTKKLMHSYYYPYRWGKVFLYISIVLMVVCVLLPYQPLQFPLLSKWHVRLAMYSTTTYIIIFLHFLCYQTLHTLNMNISFLKFYFVFIFLELLLYILNGSVSTLLETSFALIMSLFLLYLNHNK